MTTPLPLRPDFKQYQQQAEDLLLAATAGDTDALSRINQEPARNDTPALTDAQLAIATEHGYEDWDRFERVVDLIEPFRAALYPGDADTIRALLKQAPELAVSEPWPSAPGYKPIEGVSSGCVWHRPQQTQIAGMFVDAGAQCSITIAARAGLVDHVRRLLDEDPSLLNSHDRTGRTAMYRAGCVFGNFPEGEAVVDLLLERGATLDFYVACTFGMLEEVERMLEADPTWATRLDPDGMTSLHWAIRHRRTEDPQRPVGIVRALVAAGADVNAINPQEEEMQPIHHCGEWSGWPEQAALLLEHGADINATAGNGWTPLDYANDRGRKEMALCLQSHGGTVSGIAGSESHD